MEHEFFIFWVPRRTLVSNSILEEAGIIGDVNISEFPLYFMPLEEDVLSLELDSVLGMKRAMFRSLQRLSWISNRDTAIFPE